MSSRRFKPDNDYDVPYIPRRKARCYDEKKVVHILVDLTMGAPVEITLKDSKEVQHNGYYLQFDRKNRTIHFQPFGESEVQEIDVGDICTIRYGS
ncbi:MULTISPECIES: hypothetical protein [unclassified Sporosarcina]|uniref:hypothetical protein n=1 Tax=unclassified Sporosarcina TaxID=2647733 RepID=UPI000C169298|nr:MULTISPECIES: hypothetical protein [unclassified Sporosarcina]PIC99979.1 hypothetical protein CSV68_05860 [Sporosarcina sp. P29]PID04383.1 hypothetical protein CSV66_15355 [Sporosarcina sp. P30]PID07561.1 hypothetical protein CSV65_15425 [Sporosarcina sp. P31]PID10768.1 hypothetical protein CSV64_15360 [Sporosarcina sp. P32b]